MVTERRLHERSTRSGFMGESLVHRQPRYVLAVRFWMNTGTAQETFEN